MAGPAKVAQMTAGSGEALRQPPSSYCTDRYCRQSGERHLHEPFVPRPSLELRVKELERIGDLQTVEIVKLWNKIQELENGG